MPYSLDRYSRLSRLFLKVLQHRNRLLPEQSLNRYVESFLTNKGFLLESAQRFGTPQYLFDEPALKRAITGFKETFSRHLPRYHVFYALKSNSFSGLCRQVVSEGLGLDVSSGLELSQALKTRCKRIIFSGPGKTTEELELAFKNRDRVTLQVDSFSELRRLSKILASRYSPHNGVLSMGVRIHSQDSWSKFGIPLQDLPLMLKQAAGIKGLDPCGVQFHASWNMNPEAQVSLIKAVGACLSRAVPKSLWPRLRFLDIGGGFWPETGEWLNTRNTPRGQLLEIIEPRVKLNYQHYYQPASPLEEFARKISRAIFDQLPPVRNMEIWMEPGRWISNSAMHILLKVLDKKDRRTVITDGGINLLGWERPLSEFVPVINLTRPALKEIKINIYGSLCTPLDVWGFSVFGQGVEEGDTLLIPDQGAYTYSLRQSFIKPLARVIKFSGSSLRVVEKEEKIIL